MPSSPQVVPVSDVFDYEIGPNGKPLIYQEVRIQLSPVNASLINPSVRIAPIQQVVKTDANGYWHVPLVPNSLLTPVDTYYTKATEYHTARIKVTGPGGETLQAFLLEF